MLIKFNFMIIKLFWKPLAWLAIICYGLLIPADVIPTKPFLNIPHLDKIIHAFLFFTLCLLLFRPFKKLNLKYYYVYALLTSVLLGAFLESIQHFFSSTRSSDIYDFIANISGIVISVFFFRFVVSDKKWEFLF